MSCIKINLDKFQDGGFLGKKHPQQKVNIKIDKIDLYVIDELAKLFDETRSQIVNSIIEKSIRNFLDREVENFDSKYLIACLADKINPEVDDSYPSQSWLFEIDTEKSILDLNNRYSDPNNRHSYEHDSLKTLLSVMGKK